MAGTTRGTAGGWVASHSAGSVMSAGQQEPFTSRQSHARQTSRDADVSTELPCCLSPYLPACLRVVCLAPHLPSCMPLNLPTRLPAYLLSPLTTTCVSFFSSASLPICLPICLPVCHLTCLCLPACFPANLSSLSLCIPVHFPSTCLFACLLL